METCRIVAKPPGPKSLEIFEREIQYASPGYSKQFSNLRVVFEEGKGALLRDVDGNVFIDFVAGVVVVNTGHSHPKVIKALTDQARSLINIWDMATPTRYKLYEKISQIVPGDLKTIQLFSGGSESAEAAMKLAKSYTKRYEIATFHGDFHGKTTGSMGASPSPRMGRIGFGPLLTGFIYAPSGYCYRCAFKMEYPGCGVYCAEYLGQVIELESTGSLAAVIAEPIPSSGGGVAVYQPEFFKKVKALCEEQGALFIDDEILAGFGRTGKMFAIEHWGVDPDIMVAGKGIASGMPCGAVISREEIMKSPPWSVPGSASTTFGGNPLVVAAALASIEVILEEKLTERARVEGEYMLKRLREMQESHQLIGDVRGKGLLIGVELVKDRATKSPGIEETFLVQRKALEGGLFLGLAGSRKWTNVIRITPPLVITRELIDNGLDILDAALKEAERS